MNLTDLSGLDESVAERLRKEDEEGFRGRIIFAAAKSDERAGSLGWETDGLEVVGKPRNWDVRSSNCLRRSAALGDVSDVSCRLSPLKLIGRTSHHFPLLSPMPRRLRASGPMILKYVHLGNWARDLGRWPAAVQVMIA